jgi:DNA-binding response OmpR family regulator
MDGDGPEFDTGTTMSMALDTRHRILLVEDDATIRSVMATAFAHDGHEVIEAATGESAVGMAATENPDLAIIDLKLPGMDGIEVVQRLRVRHDIPLVILTAYSDSNDVVRALEAGADDFLSKPIELKELRARLSALMRRVGAATPEEPSNISRAGFTIDFDTGEVGFSGQELHLTKTEFKVLGELLLAKGRILSKADLLENVWGYDYLGETRLVDTQIYRLRAKLSVVGAAERLVTVRGRGFRIVDSTD